MMRWLPVGLLLMVTTGCEPSDPLVRLAAELADVRAVEPRRSDLRRHRPCPVVLESSTGRCADGDAVEQATHWIALVDEVETRTGATGPVEGLRALSAFDVLAGASDPVALDRAVARLHVSADLRPDDPDVRNDLAVALLLRAEAMDRTWDATEALDHLQRVLDADSTHAPARFNRALALDRLGLVNMAFEEWARVGEVDPERAWRAEARDRGARLARRADSAAVHVPRVDSVLRIVARARADGSLWEAARREAALLADRGEDGVQTLIDALTGPDPDGRGLPAGLESYVEALDLWRAGALEESQRVYRRVLEFTAALGPEARYLRWRATVGAARKSIYDNEYLEAEAALSGVLLDSRRFAAAETRGHALWALALSVGNRGDMSAASSHLAAAESLFTALGQRRETAALRSMKAELLGAEGATSAALDRFVATLPLYGRDGGNLHQNLLSTAGRLVAARHPRAAVWFHREGLHLSGARENPQFRIEALIRLAQSEAQAGDSALAGAYLREARRGFPTIRDSAMALRVRAEYDELVGMHVPGLAAPARDSLLTAAVEYFADGGNRFKVPALLERRGTHRIESGRVAEGRADLLGAVATVEEQLEGMENPGQRAVLIRARSAAVEALVASHLALGDTVAALMALDGPRARASQRTGRTGGAEWPADLSASVPAGSAIVAYGLVADDAYAWVLGPDRVALRRLPVGTTALAASVDRLRFALGTGASVDGVASLTAGLWADLVAPVEPLLDGVESVTVVLDGPLHGLPISVLGDRPGDFLRRYRLVHAPSVAFALEGARYGARASPGPTLSVAASEWDPERYPGLPALAFAEDEASEVAAVYDAEPVVRPEADGLARNLEEAGIFHFAGHGLYRSDRQDLSTLVLPGPGGGLTAARIAGLDLSGLRLAVLAACSTQEGSRGAEGGLSGLTWSFLDAGARGVVGSLWAIPDQATSRLMIDLHRRVAAGEEGADALRAAQLEAAGAGDAGWTWAAFRYEGR